ARQVPFRFGIGCRAVVEILPLLHQRLRPIGKLVALDYALTGRHAQTRLMILDIPGGRVQHLPDALQVGSAVDGRGPIGHLGGSLYRSSEENHCNRTRETVSHFLNLLEQRRLDSRPKFCGYVRAKDKPINKRVQIQSSSMRPRLRSSIESVELRAQLRPL